MKQKSNKNRLMSIGETKNVEKSLEMVYTESIDNEK